MMPDNTVLVNFAQIGRMDLLDLVAAVKLETLVEHSDTQVFLARLKKPGDGLPPTSAKRKACRSLSTTWP